MAQIEQLKRRDRYYTVTAKDYEIDSYFRLPTLETLMMYVLHMLLCIHISPFYSECMRLVGFNSDYAYGTLTYLMLCSILTIYSLHVRSVCAKRNLIWWLRVQAAIVYLLTRGVEDVIDVTRWLFTFYMDHARSTRITEDLESTCALDADQPTWALRLLRALLTAAQHCYFWALYIYVFTRPRRVTPDSQFSRIARTAELVAIRYLYTDWAPPAKQITDVIGACVAIVKG